MKIKVKNKNLNASSRNWLNRHLNDPFVAKAKIDGYRSRAAYKLIEINQKYKIFKRNQNILDLGAAPGGWSQVSKELSQNSKIIAIDLLLMHPILGVEIIQDDFNSLPSYLTSLDFNDKFDVILSDMAPSTCGIKSVDHIRIMNILENVFEFSKEWLKQGGSLVAKVFQGGTENTLLKELKKHFKKVNHFKPKSSRKESTELYLIAQDFINVI